MKKHLDIHQESFFFIGENHPCDPKRKTIHKFKEDLRVTKPGLHLLYLGWAIDHLRAADLAILTFSEFSNVNTLGLATALVKERKKLVWEFAHYAEADIILRKLGLSPETRVVDQDTGENIN